MEIYLDRTHTELLGSKGRWKEKQHASSSLCGEVKDNVGLGNSEKSLYTIHQTLGFGLEVSRTSVFHLATSVFHPSNISD